MTTKSANMTEQATFNRLKKVFSMGVASNVLSMLTNFLLPPLFISSIGVERYGSWLYLFSIPTSLAICDLGISAAFSTEIYRYHAEGDIARASRLFKTGVKIIGGLIVLGFIAVTGIATWQQAGHARDGEFYLTVFLLSAYVLVGFFSELLSSAYKIESRYQEFQIINIASKLVELGLTVALVHTNDFALMAAALLVLRVFSNLLIWTHTYRFATLLFIGSWRGLEPIRHLLAPAAMYAINPLIMFIALQLPLMIIGKSAGMTAVVLYTTTRTLVRLPLQISSQISFSLYTEYTRLFSTRNLEMIRSLYIKSVYIIFAGFAAYALGGYLLGPFVYRIWLHRPTDHFRALFIILLLDALFESIMRNRISLSSSINLHMRDTLFQLGCVCVSVAVLFFSAPHYTQLIDILLPAAAFTALALGYSVFKSAHINRLISPAV